MIVEYSMYMLMCVSVCECVCVYVCVCTCVCVCVCVHVCVYKCLLWHAKCLIMLVIFVYVVNVVCLSVFLSV